MGDNWKVVTVRCLLRHCCWLWECYKTLEECCSRHWCWIHHMSNRVSCQDATMPAPDLAQVTRWLRWLAAWSWRPRCLSCTAARRAKIGCDRTCA